MDVRLLGNLHITNDQGDTVEIPGKKLRTLLARLAIDNGRVVPSDVLIEDVWPTSPADGDNSLQSLVSKLRRALGDPELIVSRSPGYQLALPADAIDIARFEHVVEVGRDSTERGDLAGGRAHFDEALELWRGQPLTDVLYDEFAQSTIARLNELRLSVLEDRIDVALGLGEHTMVIGELESLIGDQPLRERLHGQLMLALYRSGRQAEALRAFERARAVLAEQLGIDPSPPLRKLEADILRQDPTLDLAARPSAAMSASVPPIVGGNLPIPLTALVGRVADLESIHRLLDAHRLVTVLGPGGAGKTRLAIEIARERESSMADDGTAWLAELAPVLDPTAVAAAIAAALGLTDSAEPALQRLRHHLADQQVLLVLDNCEHVVGAAAHVVVDLLTSCPGVSVLATSREALGVPGEVLWPTPPLSISDSTELFVQRAKAIAPQFAPDAGHRSAIGNICARLDGMPLAIELAAARVRALAIDEIADRLDDRFRLLSGGARTALPRHQTLQAVVDWSYDLLFDEERLLFDRMSVFVGSCTAADVAAVCAGDDLPARDVPDCLARLVEKSLVVAEHGHAPTRYRLLQTLAHYGRDHLVAAGDAERIRARHGAHYVALMARSEAALHGERQLEWINMARRSIDDINAAIAWAVDTGRRNEAVTMAAGLGWFWWVDGGVAEGLETLERALAVPGDIDPGVHVLGLTWSAYLSMHSDRGDLSAPRSEEAVRVARAHGDPAVTGPAFMVLGNRAIFLGHPELARELLSEACSAFEAQGDDPWARAAHLFVRAEAGRVDGDGAEAERLLNAAAHQFDAVGDDFMAALSHRVAADLSDARSDHAATAAHLTRSLDMARRYGFGALAWMISTRSAITAMAIGDNAAARELLLEAKQRGHQFGHAALRAWATNLNAVLLRQEHRFDEAHAAVSEAMQFYRTTSVPAGLSLALRNLGFIAEQQGDGAAAIPFHTGAIAESRRVNDQRGIAAGLEGLAGASAVMGDHDRARALLSEAEQLRAAGAGPPTAIERFDLDRIQAVLGSVPA